jgi:hypothetical protein
MPNKVLDRKAPSTHEPLGNRAVEVPQICAFRTAARCIKHSIVQLGQRGLRAGWTEVLARSAAASAHSRSGRLRRGNTLQFGVMGGAQPKQPRLRDAHLPSQVTSTRMRLPCADFRWRFFELSLPVIVLVSFRQLAVEEEAMAPVFSRVAVLERERCFFTFGRSIQALISGSGIRDDRSKRHPFVLASIRSVPVRARCLDRRRYRGSRPRASHRLAAWSAVAVS